MKKISLLILVLFTGLVAETISVRVTNSIPIYKTVIMKIPHIYYDNVEQNVPCNYGTVSVNKNSIGLDTILGSVIGVVAGHQVGGGHGKTAAEIAGGLGGGYIANQMRGNSNQTCYKTEFVQQKFTDYEYKEVEKIVAYKNCGFIGNREICTKTKRKQRYIYLNY